VVRGGRSAQPVAEHLAAPRRQVIKELAEYPGMSAVQPGYLLVRAECGDDFGGHALDLSGSAKCPRRGSGGVPAVLAEALRDVDGITAAYIYGSWAARHEGQAGQRPVGDIDVLVLGDPDRDQLYAALSTAEQRLARPVQATIRNRAWLESGTGAFHDTITSRPLLRLPLPDD